MPARGLPWLLLWLLLLALLELPAQEGLQAAAPPPPPPPMALALALALAGAPGCRFLAQ